MNGTDTRAASKGSYKSPVLDPDAVLVEAARNGDPAAFRELFEKYGGRILRLAQTITRNREDAEDILQESFLKAFLHLDSFRGESRFYTWLVRIAVNEVLMMLRKHRLNHVSIDEPAELDEDLIPREIEDWSPNPELQYADQELQRILADSIRQLHPALRIVFQLRDVEGLSTEETARTLGISVPAVKARLLRARLKLRQVLNPYFRRSESNYAGTAKTQSPFQRPAGSDLNALKPAYLQV
jgi:RNA polymerase sigma-70 factor (ECF subfamily)